MGCVMLHTGEAHKTYVGVKATVEPMFSVFHTGDNIKVRCYAAGDTTVPNIYFTVRNATFTQSNQYVAGGYWNDGPA